MAELSGLGFRIPPSGMQSWPRWLSAGGVQRAELRGRGGPLRRDLRQGAVLRRAQVHGALPPRGVPCRVPCHGAALLPLWAPAQAGALLRGVHYLSSTEI